MNSAQILAVAAAQSGGGALDPYGPELVQNGGFVDTSNWTQPSQVTISGGQLTATGTTLVRNATNTPVGTSENGASYRVEFTITSISSGSVTPIFSVVGTARAAPGTYVETLLATSDGGAPVIRFAGSTTASVDNVSVKKVL